MIEIKNPTNPKLDEVSVNYPCYAFCGRTVSINWAGTEWGRFNKNNMILTILREVLLLKLVLLNLKSIMKKGLCLFTTYSNMDGNLFIALNGETTNGETSF